VLFGVTKSPTFAPTKCPATRLWVMIGPDRERHQRSAFPARSEHTRRSVSGDEQRSLRRAHKIASLPLGGAQRSRAKESATCDTVQMCALFAPREGPYSARFARFNDSALLLLSLPEAIRPTDLPHRNIRPTVQSISPLCRNSVIRPRPRDAPG
jgi:hypothetical protein